MCNWEVKYIKGKKVVKTIVQIIDSISNENQQNFWQDNRSFGYCFENEQSKINFISSEISWDQILEPMTFEESRPRCIFILGKWYVCNRKPCLTFVDWRKHQKNSNQSFYVVNYQMCIYKILESNNLIKFVISKTLCLE